MKKHKFIICLICTCLAWSGFANLHAQEMNPKHKAHILEHFGIESPIPDSLDTLSHPHERMAPILFMNEPYIYASIPALGVNGDSFVIHDVFDLCGANNREECTCHLEYPSYMYGKTHRIRFAIAEPMDVLITSMLPETKIFTNKIVLRDEYGREISPSKDCYDYYNYEKIREEGYTLGIQSFYVKKLPPGVYHFYSTGVKAGNSGTGYGRVETLIIGISPDSRGWSNSETKDLSIPLEKGFSFGNPIKLGKYNEDFAHSENILDTKNYISFYNTNDTLFFYEMDPAEDESIREHRYAEYLQGYIQQDRGRNAVYEFHIDCDTMKITAKSEDKIYLLNEDKKEIANGNDSLISIVSKGKYYIVIGTDKLESSLNLKGTTSFKDPGGGSEDPDPNPNPEIEDRPSALIVNYTYNIRSWTKSIKSPLFTQDLYYNDSDIDGGNTPSYNGNISRTKWTHKNDVEKSYNFAYDALSQLKEADYKGGEKEEYGANYTYDMHGNMLTLKRKGKTDKGYGTVDSLFMSYNGNQLINVIDDADDVLLTQSSDFKDYSNGKGVYEYNANGAMKKDTHKGISNIEYNSLNLPRSIAIDNGQGIKGSVQYLYSATGVKLQTIHKIDGSAQRTPMAGAVAFETEVTEDETIDYVGNKIYKNDELVKILVDGGYYDVKKEKYYFYIQDHLGNNRVVADAQGIVVQKSDYYPFGMEFADNIAPEEQPYKYNGKELDKQHGLNMYDYSARYMEPAIGRFTSVDPLAEKYYSISPYVYVRNNPLKYIDPDGRKIIFAIMYKGQKQPVKYTYSPKTGLTDAKGKSVSIPFKSKAYSIAAAYNDVYKTDKTLGGQIDRLVKSDNEHIIAIGGKTDKGRNSVRAATPNTLKSENEVKIKKGKGVGTTTSYNFSKEVKEEAKEITGVEHTDGSIVSHELRHQYDYETGNMSDSVDKQGKDDPSEQRAVNNEDIYRRKKGLVERKTY